MKQIKLFIALLSMGFVFNLVSCTKQSDTDLLQTQINIENQNELIQEYYAPDGVDVNAKVLSFLTKTETYSIANNQQKLADFEDTEANEAMWLMEGASNYLSNENLNNNADPENEKLEYTINVTNTTDANGNILMVGSDMITKFDQIHNDIDAYTVANNKTASVVNYELTNLNSNESEISVKAVLALVNQNNNLPPVPNTLDVVAPCTDAQYFNIDIGNETSNIMGGGTLEDGPEIATSCSVIFSNKFSYNGFYLVNIIEEINTQTLYGPGDHWLDFNEVAAVIGNGRTALDNALCEKLATTSGNNNPRIYANYCYFDFDEPTTDYGTLNLERIAYGYPVYY